MIGVYTALIDATLQGNNLKVEFEQYIINIHSPLKVVGDIGYAMPGSLGTYFGKEKNISVITLETSPEDGDVAWKENKDGIYK